MKELLIGLPILYTFLNRFRGGGYPKISEPLKIKPDIIAAVITGILVGALTMDPVVGVGVAVAYFIGELFSWGKWISAAPYYFDSSWQGTYNETLANRNDGRDSGIHLIAKLLTNEYKNFTNYCLLCLTLRGIWWWGPIFAVLAVVGGLSVPVAVGATAAAGVAMPVSYYLAGRIDKINFWRLGEMIYGAVHGGILALALYTT